VKEAKQAFAVRQKWQLLYSIEGIIDWFSGSRCLSRIALPLSRSLDTPASKVGYPSTKSTRRLLCSRPSQYAAFVCWQKKYKVARGITARDSR